MDFLIVIVLGIVTILLFAIPIVWVRDQWRLCRSLRTFPLELVRMQLRYSCGRMLYWSVGLLFSDIIVCFVLIHDYLPTGLPLPLALLVLLIISSCYLIIIAAHYQVSRLARRRIRALEGDEGHLSESI